MYLLLNPFPESEVCLIVMLKDKTQPKIVILGIGNLLLRDEGVGIHLVRMLNNDDLDCSNLEIIDGGIYPEPVSFIEDAYKLIIVDAIKGGKEPGTIYHLNTDDIMTDSARPLYSHQSSIIDSLRLLRSLGKGPQDTIIIGIEPKSIDYGLELSPEVKEKLVELKEIVTAEIQKTKSPPPFVNTNLDTV